MKTKLSRRESEILALLAQGFTNQETGDALGISVKTAETYRVRLTKKLGLKTRAGLFRHAFEAGLLTAEKLSATVPGYAVLERKSA